MLYVHHGLLVWEKVSLCGKGGHFRLGERELRGTEEEWIVRTMKPHHMQRFCLVWRSRNNDSKMKRLSIEWNKVCLVASLDITDIKIRECTDNAGRLPGAADMRRHAGSLKLI